MADGTKIEWTEATWNPVTGCSLASPGCTNCYAMKLAGTRMKNHESRKNLTIDTKAGPVWNGEVRLNEQWLDQPLRWNRPRMIFVCAHGDLFHESVPEEWIDRVFAVMALATQHTFQILTKRADRMHAYINKRAGGYVLELSRGIKAVGKRAMDRADSPDRERPSWPLRNVWLGVSVEDQVRADERIPLLLKTPATVRWISAEPLLGPLKIRHYLMQGKHPGACGNCGQGHGFARCPNYGGISKTRSPYEGASPTCTDFRRTDFAISWVVVGGESGSDARPMHPDWARSLRDQCAAAAVPFLFKQWGEFVTVFDRDVEDPDWRRCGGWEVSHPKGQWWNLAGGTGFHGERVVYVDPVGKKAAGRLLDGVQHDGYPGEAPKAETRAEHPKDTRLWCVHHIGADDIHAAPDFETAQTWATWANKHFAAYPDISRFVVAVWPWTAKKHGEDLPRAVADWTRPAGSSPTTTDGEKYLVWSNEHSAWWGRERCGYTRIIANAGRYNRAEALSIAGTRDGGWHVCKGNPDEIAIPEQDAIDQYADITRAQREDGAISEAEIPY